MVQELRLQRQAHLSLHLSSWWSASCHVCQHGYRRQVLSGSRAVIEVTITICSFRIKRCSQQNKLRCSSCCPDEFHCITKSPPHHEAAKCVLVIIIFNLIACWLYGGLRRGERWTLALRRSCSLCTYCCSWYQLLRADEGTRCLDLSLRRLGRRSRWSDCWAILTAWRYTCLRRLAFWCWTRLPLELAVRTLTSVAILRG